MAYALPKSVRPLAKGPLLAVAAGAAYVIAYRFSELLDPWTLYGQGISLLFLPAGIKHLAMLVGRGWGALGCFVGLLLVASEVWPQLPAGQLLVYAAVSTLASWWGIRLGMALLGLRSDLSNLRFLHLPLLDLVTTAVHGAAVNGYFIAAGLKSENFLGNALAMITGDFMGCLLVFMLFWAGLETWRVARGRRGLD